MKEDKKETKRSKAAVIGSTGLIGGHLAELLHKDPAYEMVRLVVRRPVRFDHPKFQIKEIDFEDHDAFRAAVSDVDVLFCAVGTTTKKVKGDRQAYRKVDVDIPLNAAKFFGEGDGQHFLVVSSIGAGSTSRTFYLRLKGEVEEKLRETDIPSVSVFRPSLLLGKRGEHRFGERFAQWVMPSVSFLVPSKYKPIRARDVAGAMVGISHHPEPGFRIYHYAEMKKAIADKQTKSKNYG
jgi:uncharacterized protein YbjT (DUF2867 family)